MYCTGFNGSLYLKVVLVGLRKPNFLPLMSYQREELLFKILIYISKVW